MVFCVAMKITKILFKRRSGFLASQIDGPFVPYVIYTSTKTVKKSMFVWFIDRVHMEGRRG